MTETEQPGATSKAGDLRSRLARLEPPARLPGVDMARGAAVLGMFAAHLTVTTSLQWGSPATWTGMVDGRSSILFATLAGLSLGLTVREEPPRDGRRLPNTRRRLAVRAAAIWAFGIFLITLGVPVHVILPAYGVLFAIGILLVALSTRALVVLALVLAVTMPFLVGFINAVGGGADEASTNELSIVLGWHYPFPLWTAFLAAGIASGRLLLVSVRHAAILVAVGGAFAVFGYAVLGPVGDLAVESLDEGSTGGTGLWLLSQLRDEPHSSGMGEAIGSGGFALAVIGGCTLVGITRLRWLFWPVRVLGSMPLTAYTAHIVVWSVWIRMHTSEGGDFDPTEDFVALEPFWPMTFGVTAGCVLWAVLVGRGPLEAALSRLSAGPAGRTASAPPGDQTPRPR